MFKDSIEVRAVLLGKRIIRGRYVYSSFRVWVTYGNRAQAFEYQRRGGFDKYEFIEELCLNYNCYTVCKTPEGFAEEFGKSYDEGCIDFKYLKDQADKLEFLFGDNVADALNHYYETTYEN